MAKYNDGYTVKLKTVDYLNGYGREDITIHNLVLNLNAREQNVIQNILNMLNSDLVKWDKDFKHLLYVNPFLYNIHNKFDTRVLNIFGI